MESKLIQAIINEEVKYTGLRNFASKGIGIDAEGLVRAFSYGFDVGVECTKEDVIKLIKEHMEE